MLPNHTFSIFFTSDLILYQPDRSHISVHNSKWTMVIVSLVLVILAAESCVGSENSKLVYIKPSSNTICNVKLCLTLSQLDGQISHPISNATLILLPGTHNLFFNFSVANLTELLVYPNSSSELMIVCQKNASFEFKNISYFLIKRLKFIGCGRNKIQMVHEFYLKESTFVGKKRVGQHLNFFKQLDLSQTIPLYQTNLVSFVVQWE